ncbi:hypothetical protein GDO86_004613 [Hymenochirus boettgeri]|uniref:Uncharacterized protein n=1 Tax=Hymenochirus boettgeri TaxID=247094 RepID=A0A8T2KE42_9PIPI|nr:hypothetical protein GDO86_004613 [Hymenochirus boettgeri]
MLNNFAHLILQNNIHYKNHNIYNYGEGKLHTGRSRAIEKWRILYISLTYSTHRVYARNPKLTKYCESYSIWLRKKIATCKI